MPGAFFKHACVGDLAWAGFAEPMMQGEGMEGAQLRFGEFWQQRLQALDADPSPLLEFLGDTPGGRLGVYYERLWHYLLDQDPDTELIAHNLRVQDGTRTVGEFDCIYWCARRQAHVHLELAVKYYLGIPGARCWLGPGGHDRLDRKLTHLMHRQSRLGRHPAGRKTLRAVGVERCLSLVDIKGYLFAPAEGMPPPDQHNPGNRIHRWYTLEQFAELAALPAAWQGWQKIPRQRWLSPFRVGHGKHRSPVQLQEHLCTKMEQRRRPLQLAACDAAGRERYRCFVTPNDWPSTT